MHTLRKVSMAWLKTRGKWVIFKILCRFHILLIHCGGEGGERFYPSLEYTGIDNVMNLTAHYENSIEIC